ncbi:hypothetical protein BDZ45DRAFT_799839 [Acephala macrosclerotiorum]|nr:hypothetical protein BDZ45DRAFT_799839 [Acephala macrosclerotiorum]
MRNSTPATTSTSTSNFQAPISARVIFKTVKKILYPTIPPPIPPPLADLSAPNSRARLSWRNLSPKLPPQPLLPEPTRFRQCSIDLLTGGSASSIPVPKNRLLDPSLVCSVIGVSSLEAAHLILPQPYLSFEDAVPVFLNRANHNIFRGS